MGDRRPQRVQVGCDALNRLPTGERLLEHVPVVGDDLPEFSKRGEVDRVVRARCNAGIELALFAFFGFLTDMRWHLRVPPVGIFVGESVGNQRPDGLLKRIEHFVVWRHRSSFPSDFALNLRVVGGVRVDDSLTAASKVDRILLFHKIKFVFQEMAAHPEDQDCGLKVVHHWLVSRCSRRLLKMALKTATSEVAGKCRLTVYPRLRPDGRPPPLSATGRSSSSTLRGCSGPSGGLGSANVSDSQCSCGRRSTLSLVAKALVQRGGRTVSAKEASPLEVGNHWARATTLHPDGVGQKVHGEAVRRGSALATRIPSLFGASYRRRSRKSV
jgi:hypothetical protein